MEKQKVSLENKMSKVEMRKIFGYKTQSEEIIRLLDTRFRIMGFSIVEQPNDVDDPDRRTYFLLNAESNEEVGLISVSASTHQSRPYTTRLSFRQDDYIDDRPEEPAIFIPWVSVNVPYQGRGLGAMILIYGICKTYLSMHAQGVYAKYIKLDDDSDKSKDVKNIYSTLGLVHVGLVSFTGQSSKGTYAKAKIEHGIGADNAKEGRIETFFEAAYPYYMKKIQRRAGGQRLLGKKTYRRKRYSRNKRNIKSRKHH